MAPHSDNISVSGGKISPATVQIHHPHCGPEGTQLDSSYKAVDPGFVTYQSSLSPHSTTSSAGDSGVECLGQQDQQQQGCATVPEQQQYGLVNYIPISAVPHQTQGFQIPATHQYSPVMCHQHMGNGNEMNQPSAATAQYARGPPIVIVPQYPFVNPPNIGNFQSCTEEPSTKEPLSVVVDQPSHMMPAMHQAPPPHMQQYAPYQPIQQLPPQNGFQYSTNNLPHQFVPYTANHPSFMPRAYNTQPSAPAMNAVSAPLSTGYFSDSSASTSSGMSSPASQITPQPDEMNVSVSRRLENIWEKEFQHLFCQFPIPWQLNPSMTVPPIVDEATVDPDEPEMQTYMDSAKVRFICPNCQHCWTSMKGRVQFGCVINKDNTGLVVFKLFGQKCQTCSNPEWVHAMWYPEEIKKAIYNVCQKVGQAFYSWRKPVVRLDRRQGRPSKPHNTDSCQACSEGICREERNFV